jgi:hypothetical protein
VLVWKCSFVIAKSLRKYGVCHGCSEDWFRTSTMSVRFSWFLPVLGRRQPNPGGSHGERHRAAAAFANMHPVSDQTASSPDGLS